MKLDGLVLTQKMNILNSQQYSNDQGRSKPERKKLSPVGIKLKSNSNYEIPCVTTRDDNGFGP